jgi:hypothetical protein
MIAHEIGQSVGQLFHVRIAFPAALETVGFFLELEA